MAEAALYLKLNELSCCRLLFRVKLIQKKKTQKSAANFIFFIHIQTVSENTIH